MSKDQSERRTYRRSPGRQYDSEFDPLRSRTGASRSGQLNSNGARQSGRLSSPSDSRSGSLHTQRPDPRRTRQLLRQQIISSKAPATEEGGDELRELETDELEQRMRRTSGNISSNIANNASASRSPNRTRNLSSQAPYLPATHDLYLDEDNEWEQAEFDEVIDDEYEDDPLDERLGYASPGPGIARSAQLRPRRSVMIHDVDERRAPSGRLAPPLPPEEEYDEPYEEYDDEGYEEIDEREARRQKKRNKKVSRRGILIGLGAAAVATAGVTAYELGPKIPQAISDTGSNIEHQIQDAFNKGMAQGAENARKEFITALDNLEGFTLQGAIEAAKLTRVAYDVFVAPIVQFGSTVATDFLKAMLSALKTARGLLAGVYQDNATLQAIQKVLESWVSQVQNMPKQLTAVTQTDLDGAQAYLRALQRKIDDEKAKLNNPQPSPTVPASPQATPRAKQ